MDKKHPPHKNKSRSTDKPKRDGAFDKTKKDQNPRAGGPKGKPYRGGDKAQSSDERRNPRGGGASAGDKRRDGRGGYKRTDGRGDERGSQRSSEGRHQSFEGQKRGDGRARPAGKRDDRNAAKPAGRKSSNEKFAGEKPPRHKSGAKPYDKTKSNSARPSKAHLKSAPKNAASKPKVNKPSVEGGEFDDPNKPQRIAKVIARAGICSRRDAERLLEEGRVTLNGQKLDSAAHTVMPQDTITVDGKPLPSSTEPRIFRYHKPAGLVTTNKDEKDRATIFDKLPDALPRVVTIGRLDINTEGLLLLTNDGEISGMLEHPDTGWSRRYRVRVHGQADQEKLKRIKRGATIDGIKYAPAKIEFEKTQSEGVNQWLTITLHEGKNREVKRLMEYCGLQVNRLIRMSYGPFQLGKLPKGAVEEVKPRILKDQVPGFAEKLKAARPKVKPEGSKEDAVLDKFLDDL